jgi:hypothetical protein
MVAHVIIWNCYGGRSVNRIYQSIGAGWQGAVVHPYVARSEDWYPIAVRSGSPAEMFRWVTHFCISTRLAVMYVQPVAALQEPQIKFGF